VIRNPWELEAHARDRNARLNRDLTLWARRGRDETRWPRRLTLLRRRLGIGLMQIGATVAGRDALRSLPAPPAWPDLANR
jgi:hypothetical protein